MRTKRITSADIFARHPKGLIFNTDKDYASVAQKVYRILNDKIVDMSDVTIRNMAINCALYLEDIASNVGIWETFVTLHRDLYGKDLPFFETGKDYCLGDPNLQDIKVILWISIAQTREQSIINPETPALNKVSSLVFECIDSAFDEVYVNEQLRNYLYSFEMYDNFLYQRDVLKWLYLDCYLTRALDCKVKLDDFQNQADIFLHGLDKEQRYYAAECAVCFDCKCGPLALYPKDYLARMLEIAGMKKQAGYVREQEYRPMDINKVLTWNKESVEYVNATGQTFKVKVSSYDNNIANSLGKHSYNIGSFVKYKGKWQTNGISSWGELDSAFESLEAYKSGNRANMEKVEKFLEAHPSSKIIYAKNLDDLKRKYKEIGIELDGILIKEFKKAKEIVIFISQNEGVCIIANVASLIAAPDNPYYNKPFAESGESFKLIFNTTAAPGEFIRYLIQEHLLPDAALNSFYGQQRGKELFQDNIDFFARIYRQNNY